MSISPKDYDRKFYKRKRRLIDKCNDLADEAVGLRVKVDFNKNFRLTSSYIDPRNGPVGRSTPEGFRSKVRKLAYDCEKMVLESINQKNLQIKITVHDGKKELLNEKFTNYQQDVPNQRNIGYSDFSKILTNFNKFLENCTRASNRVRQARLLFY